MLTPPPHLCTAALKRTEGLWEEEDEDEDDEEEKSPARHPPSKMATLKESLGNGPDPPHPPAPAQQHCSKGH